jgi:hypothetical protein
MALFSFFSSETSQFKNKFTNTLNLMINYSFGHLNVKDDVAFKQIEAGYLDLLDTAKKISNPFDNNFNVYLSVSKTKISIATAILVITNAFEFVQNKEILSKKNIELILLQAIADVNTENGKEFVRYILTNR